MTEVYQMAGHIIYKKIALENSYDLFREYIWLYRGIMKEYIEI